MPELKLGPRTLDMAYNLKLYGVSDALFDELVDEDTKAELFDGVMIVHSLASPRHNRIAGCLRDLMSFYAEEKEIGWVYGPDDLIQLATGRRFAPDIFYLENPPECHPEKQYEGVPDLVVEVLSPSNRDDDLEDKRPAYRQAGVREIWFVDPENRQVIADRRRKRSYTTAVVESGRLTATALAGFWIELAWLWADPLPKKGKCLREILK